MGLFSSICGCLGSLCSAVGGLLGACATGLTAVLSPAFTIVGLVAAVIKIVKVLFPEKKEEDVEEVGYKGLDPENKKPEDFPTWDEYRKYIDSRPFDKTKFDSLSEEEKNECRLMGSAIFLRDVSEKTGVEVTPRFARAVDGANLSSEEIGKLIDSAKASGMTNLDSIADHFEGKSTNPESTTKVMNQAFGGALQALEVMDRYSGKYEGNQ